MAVDLASEQATLKALRKQQMDKPPPVAMKKNPETVRTTAHFHIQVLGQVFVLTRAACVLGAG